MKPKYFSLTVVFELCINLLLKYYITLFTDFVEGQNLREII